MTQLNTLYWVQVNKDIAETVNEDSLWLAVRTLVGDNIEAGVPAQNIRMITVKYNGEFSAILTKKAWQLAREILHGGKRRL